MVGGFDCLAQVLGEGRYIGDVRFHHAFETAADGGEALEAEHTGAAGKAVRHRGECSAVRLQCVGVTQSEKQPIAEFHDRPQIRIDRLGIKRGTDALERHRV